MDFLDPLRLKPVLVLKPMLTLLMEIPVLLPETLIAAVFFTVDLLLFQAVSNMARRSFLATVAVTFGATFSVPL